MIKSFLFAFLYFTGLTKFIAWFTRHQVKILCYHNVTPRPELVSHLPWKLYIGCELFESHLDYLQKNYQVISLQDFLDAQRENRPLPPYSVVLTFDDGKRNFLTVTSPLLSSRSMPATTFIITDKTDKASDKESANNKFEWSAEDNHSYLSWADVNVLIKEQIFQIGSHTSSHPRLLDISLEEAEEELRNSYNSIVENTGVKEIPLSYPHGQTSSSISKLAETIGYTCGLTNYDGGNNKDTSPYLLNRIIINSDDTLYLFAARIAGITGLIKQIRISFSPLIQKIKSLKELKKKEIQVIKWAVILIIELRLTGL